MSKYHAFFSAIASARLTGEQSRVLFCLMSKEFEDEIWIDKAEILKKLELSDSNFSRAMKALKDKGVVIQSAAAGYDGKPKLRINLKFAGEDLNHIESPPTNDPVEIENLLYEATSVFLKELYMVHASHLVYRVIGLNAKKYRGAGAEFINFSQLLAQRTIVTGLENLFEKLGDGEGLCSIRGLMRLAKPLKIKNKQALISFVTKYGGEPSDDWHSDVEKILSKERARIGKAIKLTSALRNNRIAHLTHSVTPRQYMLPSIAETEQVIEFAHDFYSFITVGFLNSVCGAELRLSIGHSLVSLLRQRFGVTNARFDFDDQPQPVT
ncbi:MAG: hypothetical protein J0H83_19445 [Candidatus Melainabacteria bacterium]|jgi:hypothetical protein|nr:hypothetical protein [Candidatus Melainabacteria bacterium]